MKPLLNVELIKALVPYAWMLVVLACAWGFKGPISQLFSVFIKVFERTTSAKAVGVELGMAPPPVEAKPEIKAIAAGAAEDNSPTLEETPTALLEANTSGIPMLEVLIALEKEGEDEATCAFEKVQSAETDGIQKQQNEGFFLWMKYNRGDTTALEKLHELAERPGAPAAIYRFIGGCYSLSHLYDKAAQAFDTAAEKAVIPAGRAAAIVSAAENLYTVGRHTDAFAKIASELQRASDSTAKTELYTGLSNLYKQSDDQEMYAIALEKALENSPNDMDLLFKAAYALSHGREHNELSLLYYKTLLVFNPKDQNGLNNVGVQYQRLDMPTKSIEAFKGSFDNNNTLAAANLAYRYLEAGFAEEAEAILNKAKQQEDVHPNVGSAWAALGAAKEQEAEREKEVVKTAIEEQTFLRDFAEAFFCPPSSMCIFDGTWAWASGQQVEITTSGDKIQGEWLEEGVTAITHKFEGTMQNCGIRITSYSASYNTSQPYSIVGPAKKAEYGYAYLIPEANEVRVLNYKGGKHVAEHLRRVV